MGFTVRFMREKINKPIEVAKQTVLKEEIVFLDIIENICVLLVGVFLSFTILVIEIAHNKVALEKWQRNKILVTEYLCS